MQVLKEVIYGCNCNARKIEKILVEGMIVYRIESKIYLWKQTFVCPKCKYEIILNF